MLSAPQIRAAMDMPFAEDFCSIMGTSFNVMGIFYSNKTILST